MPKWIGGRGVGLCLVLALAWLPAACGNKGSGSTQNVNVSSSSGGGTGGGIGGGLNPGGNGVTTGTTTGPGPSPSPSSGGTGTTGSGTTGASNVTVNVNARDMLGGNVTNLLKPMGHVEPIQGQVAVVQGLGLGPSNGQVTIVNATAVNGTPTALVLQANQGSQLPGTFTNPFDLESDASSNLLLTDGLGSGQANGRLIRITNISLTATNATGNVSNATTQSFNSPLFIARGNAGTVFVTEYAATPQGTVWSVNLNTGNATRFMTGLNFPAGIATDGNNLFICENAGTGGASGNLYRVPVNVDVTTGPIGPTNGNVTQILPPAGDTILRRPFECRVDGSGGLVVADGMGLTFNQGPGPAGPGNGGIRYVPQGSNQSRAVLTGGLQNCAGLSILGTAGTRTTAFFVQANNPGSLQSVSFDITSTTPNTTATFTSYFDLLSNNLVDGLNNPIDTLPTATSNGLPVFCAVNFIGQQSRLLRLDPTN